MKQFQKLYKKHIYHFIFEIFIYIYILLKATALLFQKLQKELTTNVLIANLEMISLKIKLLLYVAYIGNHNHWQDRQTSQFARRVDKIFLVYFIFNLYTLFYNSGLCYTTDIYFCLKILPLPGFRSEVT